MYFALVAMLGLLGLRIFEATGSDIADLGEEHGHRVLRVCGKGTKIVLVPLRPAVGRAIDRAIGARTGGPILLNSRGARMDRHAWAGSSASHRHAVDIQADEAAGGAADPVRCRPRQNVSLSTWAVPESVLLANAPLCVDAALLAVDPVADHEDDADPNPDDEDSGCDDDDP